MVKRVGGGGTKRKIDKMEKIPKREYRATTFSKRCSGLYSKAAQLCLLADAQIAILATPPSSQSNVSFFSFGHSSVDAVVKAYLTGRRLAPVREEPMEEDIGVLMARKELGLELWWEKESLCESKDPRELMDAVKAMERMLSKLRSGDFVSDEEDVTKSNEIMAKKSNVVLHQGTQEPDETLDIQAVCCVPGDDLPHEGFDKITEEQDQILALCATDNNINGLSGSGLDVYSQEVDIDELIDWTTFESSVFDDGVLDSTQEHQGSLLMNFEAAAHDVSTNPNPPMSVSEGVEEEALVFQNKAANDVSTMNPDDLIYDFEGVVEEEGFVFQNSVLDEDNLQFSDYFN
ncbi:agamous-like MADS-box protein AGL97 [Brassica rapa]|uniref:(rape) hypothetical protein n=1 Tax=Brassica napus TaxID=3708 RepID=A0A816SLJ7_BRANA|nr:agamous-like MADS-box protein AGL97 [Brassica rapa]CAF2089498.1 unnamed protein product [Brassica napus]